MQKIIADKEMKILAFTGGTGWNTYVRELMHRTSFVSYAIPTSDNGGSTAVILKFHGGPAIGDIRSRLIRLAGNTLPQVTNLLSYRLPKDENFARKEWGSILDFSHNLWEGIDDAQKYFLGAHLRTFEVHTNIRTIERHSKFSYENGSIGNFFFTGSRLYSGSLETAIWEFSRIVGISENTEVLPVLSSNQEATLSALFTDGTRLVGQHEISHPGTLDSRSSDEKFSTKFKEVYYSDCYGNRLPVLANPKIIERINNCNMFIYSPGSLATSLMPSIIVGGVGETIYQRNIPKVLILNTKRDRETSQIRNKREYVDFAVNGFTQFKLKKQIRRSLTSSYITHIIEPVNSVWNEGSKKMTIKGIDSISLKTEQGNGMDIYPEKGLIDILQRIYEG